MNNINGQIITNKKICGRIVYIYAIIILQYITSIPVTLKFNPCKFALVNLFYLTDTLHIHDPLHTSLTLYRYTDLS